MISKIVEYIIREIIEYVIILDNICHCLNLNIHFSSLYNLYMQLFLSDSYTYSPLNNNSHIYLSSNNLNSFSLNSLYTHPSFLNNLYTYPHLNNLITFSFLYDIFLFIT